MKILSQEYINPFGADLDTSLLYNLSSGVPVDKSLSDGILKLKETGKELLETFADKLLVNRKTNFHQSIKREKPVLFESSLKNTLNESLNDISHINTTIEIYIGTCQITRITHRASRHLLRYCLHRSSRSVSLRFRCTRV